MGTSLALLEREGGTLQGSLCWPLKIGGFGYTFECTSKGYVEMGTSLALLERGGRHFTGLALLASQKWWFCCTFECTG